MKKIATIPRQVLQAGQADRLRQGKDELAGWLAGVGVETGAALAYGHPVIPFCCPKIWLMQCHM
ncbi:hypothetical protein BY996DRAFT_6516916 [Phakopsora pachyrhizi]|nr:hypothetical protein BY996DRAFT_6516916 [Phakopsora pachyrhizi]